MLVLVVIFGAAAVLAGRAVIPGLEGQMRKMVCAGSTAVSSAMLTASVLLVLRHDRVKDARTIETGLAKNSRPVRCRSGAAQRDDDDSTGMLHDDDDGFEIKYEITFIHTEEFIP